MRARGLVINDEPQALLHLQQIGYYRLTGYMIPFQRMTAGQDRHDFKAGASFDQILDLYTF